LINDPVHIDEDEMVAAFVEGERSSPLLRHRYEDCINSREVDDATLLGCVRGYPDMGLFKCFPNDVVWTRGTLPFEAQMRCKYLNQREWELLAGSSDRRTHEASRHIAENVEFSNRRIIENVKAIREIFESKQAPHGQVILVKRPQDNFAIMLEGNKRLTANLMFSEPFVLEAILGESCRMDEWHFY